MDKKDLKIQALLEKVSSLTTNYENTIADLRVDLTFVTKRVEELEAELASRNVDVQEEDTTTDTD